jgi:hypothetical protein
MADDADVVRDLPAAEYAFCRRREPGPSIAAHQARFPQRAAVMEDWLRTVREQRLRRGPWRLNCPHCHSPIALAADDFAQQLRSLLCSQFSPGPGRVLRRLADAKGKLSLGGSPSAPPRPLQSLSRASRRPAEGR